jgi:outer membrane cobalamin receptor
LRVPTLNELYRQFRQGNTLTLANPRLQPETLVGVETGFDWIHRNTRVSFTLFRNDLSSLIVNTTQSISPTLILRQRTNQSSAVSRGIETSVTHHWSHWTAEAAYLYADARVSTGALIPQVPKQQGTAGLTYQRGRTLVSGGLRAIGLQFDDDLNQFKLAGFAVMQISAEEKITEKLSAIAVVDNFLDRSFLVALTPTPNTGNPRQWRLGLRWSGSIF